MYQSPRFYIVAFVAVLSAGLLQYSLFASIGGPAANAILAVLLVLALLTDSAGYYLLLVAEGVALFTFFPGFDRSSFALAAVALAVFAMKHYFLWRSALNTLIAIALGTAVFYAAADARFLIQAPVIVAQEAVYNCGIGLLVYWSLQRFIS